jgi:hypothetical protein
MNTLPATEAASDPQEAGTLARELAAAYIGMVEHYREVFKLSTAEAVAKTEQASDGYLASVLKGPPDQVSWHGLDHHGKFGRASERASEEITGHRLPGPSLHGASRRVQ